MQSTVEKKESIRGDILHQRLRLPFEEIFGLSSAVQKRFLELKRVKSAHCLALYASFKNEVLTDAILEYALSQGTKVFFPRVVKGKKGLVFLKVNGKKDLAPGSYEIQEPAHAPGVETANPSSFDIIVVPGVAFDVQGNRLGYGKGYYDRILKDIKGKCLIVGLAFNFQVLKAIPEEAHDIAMDKIITENIIIDIERGD